MRECTFKHSPHVLHGATNDRSGRPHLLFLHGVSRNWRTFHTLYPALHESFHISALDFRGHGQSARMPGRYCVTDYVDDAIICLACVNARASIIYGHSLGAMVAFAVAAKAPDHVRAIILEDPPFSTMGRDFPGTPLGEYFRGMKATVESSRDEDALFKIFGDLIVGGRPLREQRDEASLRFAAEGFTTLDPAVFEPILAGRWLEGYDFEALLGAIRCPVLLFQADRKCGGMLSDQESALIRDSLPNCRLIQVKDAPHLIHWTQPQIILDELISYP